MPVGPVFGLVLFLFDRPRPSFSAQFLSRGHAMACQLAGLRMAATKPRMNTDKHGLQRPGFGAIRVYPWSFPRSTAGSNVKRIKPHQDRGALELIEQAVHLLRTAPAGTLASYYLGALPFVLGLLYFWTDMSRSPFAYDHLAAATLGVAALFLWMKFWQSVFARRLRAMMTGEPPPLLNLRRAIRVFLAQTALQPTGLFLLPLASIPILPFGWVFAFYQSLTVLDDGESTQLRSAIKAAGQQAALWPKQNHVLLVVLAGFGFCVFLNWTTLCLGLPVLLKTLLGVESFFSRSALSMLNTTFFAAIFSLTYLSVDPILKAGYALRCFYGQSGRSGEDLKADLRRFSVGGQPAAACLILMFALSASLCASESPPGFGLRQSSGALDLGAARPHRACAVTERGGVGPRTRRSASGRPSQST